MQGKNIKMNSKHEHIFKPCLIYDHKLGHYHTKTYCIFCGKLNSPRKMDIDYEVTEKAHGRIYKHLDNEEIIKRYSDFPIFHVNDFFQKTIDIRERKS